MPSLGRQRNPMESSIGQPEVALLHRNHVKAHVQLAHQWLRQTKLTYLASAPHYRISPNRYPTFLAALQMPMIQVRPQNNLQRLMSTPTMPNLHLSLRLVDLLRRTSHPQSQSVHHGILMSLLEPPLPRIALEMRPPHQCRKPEHRIPLKRPSSNLLSTLKYPLRTVEIRTMRHPEGKCQKPARMPLQ